MLLGTLLFLVNIFKSTSGPTKQLKSCPKISLLFHPDMKTAMSTSIFLKKVCKKPAKINNFLCSFMFVSNEESWLSCLGYQNTLAIYHVKCHGHISHGKCSWESLVEHAPDQFPTVKVSCVTAPFFFFKDPFSLFCYLIFVVQFSLRAASYSVEVLSRVTLVK